MSKERIPRVSCNCNNYFVFFKFDKHIFSCISFNPSSLLILFTTTSCFRDIIYNSSCAVSCVSLFILFSSKYLRNTLKKTFHLPEKRKVTLLFKPNKKRWRERGRRREGCGCNIESSKVQPMVMTSCAGPELRTDHSLWIPQVVCYVVPVHRLPMRPRRR